MAGLCITARAPAPRAWRTFHESEHQGPTREGREAAFVIAGWQMLAVIPQRPWRRMESTGSLASRANRSMSPPAWRQKGRGKLALSSRSFGFGQGPVFRSGLEPRNPDLVNEASRQLRDRLGRHACRTAVKVGVPYQYRVNAEFSGRMRPVEGVPGAAAERAVIAHGMTTTSQHAAARTWPRRFAEKPTSESCCHRASCIRVYTRQWPEIRAPA